MSDTPLERLRAIKQRRLELLQEQEARYGFEAPAHIVMEIEQLQGELAALQHQVRRVLRSPQLVLEAPEPAPGLILLISPLPVVDSPNKQSAFDAIDYHRTTLKHCWLIATGGEDGSLSRAYELRDYFRARQITMHVWQVEDPTDVRETYTLVDWLYSVRIPAHGLAAHQVIADLTGATKPMSVGMALACGSERPMQYMLPQATGPSRPLVLRMHAAEETRS